MPPSFMIPPKKRKLDTPAKRIHHGPTSTFKLPSTPARNVSTAARFDGYKAAFASPSPSPRIATDGSATTRAFRTLDLPFSLDCSSPTPHKSRADSATPAPTPSNETQLAKRPYSPALTSLSRTHPPLFPSSASSPRPTKKLRVIEAPHILLASQKPPVTPSPARSKNLSIPPQWNMKQIAAATQESFDSSSTLPTIKNGESKFRRGGLAERAADLMNRADTSITLWKSEVEKPRRPLLHSQTKPPESSTPLPTPTPTPTPKSQSLARPKFTTRFQVTKIVSVVPSTQLPTLKAKPKSNRPTAAQLQALPPHSVLTMCREVSLPPSSATQSQRQAETVVLAEGDEVKAETNERLVLFRFSEGNGSKLCAWKPLEEGSEVGVWRPWVEVASSCDGESKKALLCSRFLVL